MAKHILFCRKCGNYTMKEKCPECGSVAGHPRPPKYSPDDKYAEYRRKVKREELEKEGIV